MLPTLPGDITLVRPSQLLNEPLRQGATPPASTPVKPRTPVFRAPGVCKPGQPLPAVPQSRAVEVVTESITGSPLVQSLKQLF